jgi:hypothetical protein
MHLRNFSSARYKRTSGIIDIRMHTSKWMDCVRTRHHTLCTVSSRAGRFVHFMLSAQQRPSGSCDRWLAHGTTDRALRSPVVSILRKQEPCIRQLVGCVENGNGRQVASFFGYPMTLGSLSRARAVVLLSRRQRATNAGIDSVRCSRISSGRDIRVISTHAR